jgi:hypothetical protein
MRLEYLIDPGQNVAEVTVAEILDIGARELLPLAVAAARVGKENELTFA